MQQNCLDDPLQKWFEFRIPQTKIAKDHIEKIISEPEWQPFRPESKMMWLGKVMETRNFTQSKKGQQREMTSITFVNNTTTINMDLPVQQAEWLLVMLKKLSPSGTTVTMQELKTDYENSGLEDFELFIDNKPVSNLYKAGLLRI